MNLIRPLLSMCVVFCTVPLQAAVFVSSESMPTPGLPGFSTHTLTLVSDVPGEVIQGIDFGGHRNNNNPAIGFGFFGPMNQVNPVGLPTIFLDNNTVFQSFGHDPKQDSQFLVRSSDVVVPAGFAEEGPNILQVIWAWSNPVGQSVPVAQIVTQDGGPAITYRGIIVVRNGNNLTELPVGDLDALPPRMDVRGNGIFITPEGNMPSILNNTDFGTVMQGSLQQRIFTISNPGESVLRLESPSLSGPFSIVGDFPETIPVDATASFTLGLDTSSLGRFQGQISIPTNSVYSEFYRFALAANVIPEPASVVLAGLMAMIWLLTRRARFRLQ